MSPALFCVVVLLSSLWLLGIHHHLWDLWSSEDTAQHWHRALSEPVVSNQETKRLRKWRCVQTHQGLARTGMDVQNTEKGFWQGIGITKSLLNSGVLTFLYRPLSMCMEGFLKRWPKERVRLWKDYVCPGKNHWYKKRERVSRQFLETPHPSGVFKGRWPSREVRIAELSQVAQAVLSGRWSCTCGARGARRMCVFFQIPRCGRPWF